MKKKFLLRGLGCANCAAKMEEAINKIEGVKEATVNFLTQKLTIVGEDERISSIVEEAEKIIKKIEPQVVIKNVGK
ncbi:MAG: cation transporter [Zhaonellaceae bacterium]|jgi:copper chaperone CopZ|nr:heavy metal transporter [Clostridia bacterium]